MPGAGHDPEGPFIHFLFSRQRCSRGPGLPGSERLTSPSACSQRPRSLPTSVVHVLPAAQKSLRIAICSWHLPPISRSTAGPWTSKASRPPTRLLTAPAVSHLGPLFTSPPLDGSHFGIPRPSPAPSGPCGPPSPSPHALPEPSLPPRGPSTWVCLLPDGDRMESSPSRRLLPQASPRCPSRAFLLESYLSLVTDSPITVTRATLRYTGQPTSPGRGLGL